MVDKRFGKYEIKGELGQGEKPEDLGPNDARRLALREEAREGQAELETVRRRAIEEAQALIRQKSYATAIEGLERTAVSTGQSPELSALVNFALGEQRREERTQTLLAQAQSLLRQEQFSQSVEVLTQIQRAYPSNETEALLKSTRERWAQFEKQKHDRPAGLEFDLNQPTPGPAGPETIQPALASEQLLERVSPVGSARRGAAVGGGTPRAYSLRGRALMLVAVAFLVVLGFLWTIAHRRPSSKPPSPSTATSPVTAAPETSALPPIATSPAPTPVTAPGTSPLPPPLAPQPKRVKSRKAVERGPVSTPLAETASQGFGGLTVTSPLTGAKIVLDGSGDPAWVTPHTFDRLGAGTHHVGVLFKGGRGTYRDVEIDAGVTRKLNLAPEEPTGYLSVTTDPPGVEVILDGKSLGLSPLQKTIATGDHVVTVRLASGLESKSLWLAENALADLHFPLVTRSNGVAALGTDAH